MSNSRGKSPFKICYLYSNEMNIYGDTGNILILKKRLERRDYRVEIEYVAANQRQNFDFRTVDILFAGGGQDRGQIVVANDLRKRRKHLKTAIDDNLPVLLICGSYQLFGEYFKTRDNNIIEGAGLLPVHTVATDLRMIGNVVIDSPLGKLIGFENHSGATFLTKSELALGRVQKGYGNNGKDASEGCRLKNCIGTYLHGPLLAKNPALADDLIAKALRRKIQDDSFQLDALNDKYIREAREQALRRIG